MKLARHFRDRCHRFLPMAVFLLGWLLPLGSVAVLSGCGEDDKSAGQVKAVDVAKTPDAMDSMKAYQGQMQTKAAKNKPQ